MIKNDLKIDFGCGKSKKDGFIGVDILKLDGVDVVHDLTKRPYPFEDNVASEIYMDNVLEHLNQPLKVIEELHRISKNNGKITIAVPYFRSHYATIDPTHVNFFGVNYFNYFDPDHHFCTGYEYSKARFKVVKMTFDKEWENNSNFFHRILINFAHKYPYKYEARLSHLFPLSSLTFELKVIK